MNGTFYPLALALAVQGLGCSKDATRPAESIRPVRVHRVRAASGVPARTFSGRAEAGTEVKLSFKVAGALEQLRVKVGDRVKQGRLIAKLDEKDFRLQVGEAQASLGQALAQSRNSQAGYERVRQLYENRSTSLKDLDAARATADSARANVAAARQRVSMARSQLGYCGLHAPQEGEIASVPVEANENIKAGQTIAVLNSGAHPEVSIAVPESLIINVSQGDQASVTFDAIPDRRFPALVTEVGIATTGDTTFPVVVRLSETHRGVRAGMAAEVSIRFGRVDPKKRIFVPTHAVLEDAKGRFTFVAKPLAGPLSEAEIVRRAVTIGRLGAEGIEIVDGLAEGDLVVDSGVRFVEPGMKVRVSP